MSGQLEGIGSRTVIETSAGQIAALRGDSAGPPVLLLPGYTGSKEDFAPLFGPLTDAGYAVVSIDLPGQFESPGPADPEAYTPDRLGPIVLELVHRLGAQLSMPVVPVGAAFDFWAGSVREASPVLHGSGLEWAYRLATEPRRLWRRYLGGNPRFVRSAWRHRGA